MANTRTSNMSCLNLIYRPTSTPSPSLSDNEEIRAIESKRFQSNDNNLLALSFLPKMDETRRTSYYNEDVAFSHETVGLSNTVFDAISSSRVDVIHQTNDDPVNGTPAHCFKLDRYEALTEFLTYAKHEQGKQVAASNLNCPQHANVSATRVRQTQERCHNDSNASQVFRVQQRVARDKKQEVPENDFDENSCSPCDVQEEDNERAICSGHAEVDGSQYDECSYEAELCDRLGQVAIDFDVDEDRDDRIVYRNAEEMAQELLNQDEDDARNDVDDWNTRLHGNATTMEELEERVKQAKLSTSSTSRTRLRVHPILTTGHRTVKGVCVPQLPRGRRDERNSCSGLDTAMTSRCSNSHAKTVERSLRHKFQFSEQELLQLLEDEEANGDATTFTPAVLDTYPKLSTNSTSTDAVPLRRKSFSTTGSPTKSIGGVGLLHVACIATREVTRALALPKVTKSTEQLWTGRRKSTSACHITASGMSPRNSRNISAAKQQIVAFNSKKRITSKTLPVSPWSPSVSSPPPPHVSTIQAQMVLHVRESMRDGIPELVIDKPPVPIATWNNGCMYDPFMNMAKYMKLGPAQHGMMLKQLRYIKLMMHEMPWAKAHLRALLSKYTSKEISKEELYPQLNILGQQVQSDVSSRARQLRALTTQKQRLTVTLKLATGVVNNTTFRKYGRRGQPHVSRLLYNPKFPLQLRWRRKHGEWSAEYLALDEIQVVEVSDSFNLIKSRVGGSFNGRGIKKSAATLDPDVCLSFVTFSRSLDLQIANSLQREWLANAVRDLVSFAQEHKATKAN
ncbi:unnamed protein product [Peronospora belbahrii]|uniref:Uncharacterized protein n=1 Tax=Peronospora belbahrii TaxID=622444 RepID=A0AAU9KK55_9STRA|nr:unnamed protein product [Peronospora belbahrii]CAH0516699.1 unnamed protein product [Peronospora belbahrii]